MYTACTFSACQPPVYRSMYRSRCVYTSVTGFHSVHVCVCVCACQGPPRVRVNNLFIRVLRRKGTASKGEIVRRVQEPYRPVCTHFSPLLLPHQNNRQPQPAAVKGVFLYTGNQTLDSRCRFSRDRYRGFSLAGKDTYPKRRQRRPFASERRDAPLSSYPAALWVQLFHFSIMCQYIPHRQKTQET